MSDERQVLTCPHCGAPLPPAAIREIVTCAFCGTASTPHHDAPVVATNVQTATIPATPSNLACPRCKQRLFEGRVSDCVLLGCGACGGIWLDNDGAQRAVKTLDQKIEEMSQRAASHATDRPALEPRIDCPVCKKRMPRVHVGRAAIALDICAAHGTWFDRGELETVMEALRPRAALQMIDVPDFRKGTMTPGADTAGLIAGGAFVVLGALATIAGSD